MSALPEAPGTSGPVPAGLAQLQLRFVREVLYRGSPGLAAQIVPEPVNAAPSGAARRIGIYRSNARENFADALAAAFPLLESCVGPQEFRQLAWSCQRAHPSRSGNLFHIGGLLVAFLDEHVRSTPDDHLIDVALLEWNIQQALVAADADKPDLGRLAAMPAERHGDLKLELHPSVRLLASRYAIFPMWQTHQETLRPGNMAATAPPGNRTVPPLRQPEHLLVQRQADGIRLHRLAEPEYRWLRAMGEGSNLADSTALLIGAARGGAPADTALAGLLQTWVRQGVVTAFVLPDTVA